MKIITRLEIGLKPARSATQFKTKPLGTVAHWEGITTEYTGDFAVGSYVEIWG